MVSETSNEKLEKLMSAIKNSEATTSQKLEMMTALSDLIASICDQFVKH